MGWFSIKKEALIERLQCIANGGLTKKQCYFSERFPDAKPLIHGDEQLPKLIGRYRLKEALEATDKTAIEMARQGVARNTRRPDRRLEHLLRASDELRATFLTMESRLVEWVGLFLRNYALAETVPLLPKLSVMQNRSQCWLASCRFNA